MEIQMKKLFSNLFIKKVSEKEIDLTKRNLLKGTVVTTAALATGALTAKSNEPSLNLPSGSTVETPSLSFTGDTNMGIYKENRDTIGISTKGLADPSPIENAVTKSYVDNM